MRGYNNLKSLHESSTIIINVDITTKISALLHETQKERGMTAGFIGSKGNNRGSEGRRSRKRICGCCNRSKRSFNSQQREIFKFIL